ncbi:MAG: cysteine-rich CWC family protein [Gammaproteobacteria bacterium]
MTDTPDVHRCPLCGGANQCQVARGRGNCWCFTRPIPDEVLKRIPESARELACVCEACAFGRRDIPATLARMQEILRGRG